MRSIEYKCDICSKRYQYGLIEVNENERGILLRLPELKVEVCINCKKQLLEAIKALKEHYAIQRG